MRRKTTTGKLVLALSFTTLPTRMITDDRQNELNLPFLLSIYLSILYVILVFSTLNAQEFIEIPQLEQYDFFYSLLQKMHIHGVHNC